MNNSSFGEEGKTAVRGLQSFQEKNKGEGQAKKRKKNRMFFILSRVGISPVSLHSVNPHDTGELVGGNEVEPVLLSILVDMVIF